MKTWTKAQGLIAATFTPMNQDGSLNANMIYPYIDHLVSQGVTQVYVNGTAAEHASLTVPERKEIAEAWMRWGKPKMSRIIIQCGTGNLFESRELAKHAEDIGADCVAVVSPTYYKPATTKDMVEYCAEIAKACPNTPFMYYHFPGVTGSGHIRQTDFFEQAGKVIPNLIGAKFTSPDLYDATEAMRVDNWKYDVIIGAETILLGAMSMGVQSGIGIAFSLIGKPCNRMVDAFHRGDLQAARREQYKIQDFWSATCEPNSIPSLIRNFKALMGIVAGLEFGPTRLPVEPADDTRKIELRRILDRIDFHRWNNE